MPSGFHLLGWSCLAQLSRPPLNHCQGRTQGLGSQSGALPPLPELRGGGAGPKAARGPRLASPSAARVLTQAAARGFVMSVSVRSDSALEEFLDKASGFQLPRNTPKSILGLLSGLG